MEATIGGIEEMFQGETAEKQISTPIPFNDMYEADKLFNIELINEYERLPILWDKEHRNFKKGKPMDEAWQQLLKSFKKKYEDASVNDLKAHMRKLRHSYHRERRRLDLLNHKRGNTGYEFPTNLYYFKEFSFLNSNIGVSEKRQLKRNKDDVLENRFDSFGSLIAADMRSMKPKQELIFRELVIKLSSLARQEELEWDKTLLLNSVKAIYYS